MKKMVANWMLTAGLAGGLTLLSIGIMCSSKTLSFLGSMKVAEGITRFLSPSLSAG
jgi:hypothetical protein